MGTCSKSSYQNFLLYGEAVMSIEYFVSTIFGILPVKIMKEGVL
jgi:hypothetical protein